MPIMSHAWYKCFVSINSLDLHNYPMKQVVIPITQMNKLRHREAKSFAQGHRTSKRQQQELKPGFLTSHRHMSGVLCIFGYMHLCGYVHLWGGKGATLNPDLTAYKAL